MKLQPLLDGYVLGSDLLVHLSLQDAAFIEQQRQKVDSTASDQGDKHDAPVPVNAPIKGEDYQKLKQWKDAVGAPTFSQLHARRDR